MSITFNNTVYATGYVGEDDGSPSASFNLDNVSDNPVTVNGTVTAVGDPVTVTGLLPGGDDSGNQSTSTTLYVTQYDSSGMIQFTDPNAPNGTFRYVFSNSPLGGGQTVTFSNDSALSLYQAPAPCYVTGTLIRTARGDIAVEKLQVGDLALTSSGVHRPIKWLGHRRMDCRANPTSREIMPVCISAHAFGPEKPARDLYVSPAHAICVNVIDEVLIPASSLINGTTIQQMDVDEVTYWHVELDSHDILLAENLACESYIDMGNRGFFAEATIVDLHALPDAPIDTLTRTPADFCRPFYTDGLIVDAVRKQLARRAIAHGWNLEDASLADLHLVVDGERIEPALRGFTARFTVPADAQHVWLMSNTSRPCEIGDSGDGRNLGVCLTGMRIDDGFSAGKQIDLGDPQLSIGFHDVEHGMRRWTAGRANIPAALWADCRDTFFLIVELAGPALPRWVAPAGQLLNTRHEYETTNAA